MNIYIIIIGLMILLPIIYVLYVMYLLLSSPPSPTVTKKSLVGKEGRVIKEINPENISGKVKLINGCKIWSATADEKIERGKKVRISEVDGVHLKVDEIVEVEEEEPEEV
ncbi:MAG: NfeD family protein, partial [Candidatus Thermoplasmatota archaeon]|nr:NfeD family protein [Candidatus Thermoplasmatota archaeon]